MTFSLLENGCYANHNTLAVHVAGIGRRCKQPRVNTIVNQADFFWLDPCLDQQLKNLLRYGHHPLDLSIVEAPGVPVVGLRIVHSSSHHIFWPWDATG